MNRSRGSISIIMLLICGMLALTAHLALIYTSRELARAERNVLNVQLRTFANTAMDRFWQLEDMGPKKLLWSGWVEPEHRLVELYGKRENSSDGVFRCDYISVECNSEAARLVRRMAQYSSKMRSLAKEYALISKTELVGKEYLEDASIYTSNGEVQLPDINFLRSRVPSDIDLEAAAKWGFDNNFYYYYTNGHKLNIKKDFSAAGDVFIGNNGHIDIGDGTHLSGHVCLISRVGGISIGKNVVLDKALIMSAGDVTIDAGCRINGAIFSRSRITLLGSSTFSPDEAVVMPFLSKYFITN